MNRPLISTIDLSIGYSHRHKPILHGLDLSLEPEEVVCMVGGNGIGKSTLLKTLGAELSPLKGVVKVDGIPLNSYSRRGLARKMALVTTDTAMAGGLTVTEIVRMGRHPHLSFFERNRQEDPIIIQAIEAVGMQQKQNVRFSCLSDGEKQKTMIARALAQQTSIILLDEPFSFLDAGARVDIMRLLKQQAERRHCGILLSTHDVAQALRMADRIWLITADGQLISDTPQAIKESTAIHTLYTSPHIVFDPIQNDFISK